MKELYGVGILFFYFLKWPIAVIYPYMLTHGLHHNYILDVLWVYCIFLILKDLTIYLKKKKSLKK
ncbi:hypothetical protein [Sulfurimonas autotrophica]|uniref:hypothetical protein n=1 Tax=Sulfurimonas autotrophica TaxID=202747 RepID=UPI000A052366|nr:hypothetical protein [Sulfurimonas autotrophica]